MKGLNAKFARQYKKRDKNNNLVDVFVYTVTGSKEAIEKYKEVQGEFLRVDDKGNPLFFSTRYVGETTPLLITEKGTVVADTSEFAKMASLAGQYGGNLGQEIARNAAARLMGAPIEPVAEVAAPAVASSEELGKA